MATLVTCLSIAAIPAENCIDCAPVIVGYPRAIVGSALVLSDPLVLVNRTYVVGYCNERGAPLWVCYRVCAAAQHGTAPTYSWRIDQRTTAGISDVDYRYTGYQRGHMAPKSAMYHCYGASAVYDTFLLSNACPQLAEFNNGPWGDLEDLVRGSYSIRCEEVWIIAGPIFDDANGRTYLTKDAAHSSIPQRPVEIPDQFYKIIVDEYDGELRALALVLDHSEAYGYGTGNSVVERLSGFLVSIDEVERLTGLDFFAELPDGIEDALEQHVAIDMW